MIYNIRGTSGSGKTSLVRQLVKSYEAPPIWWKDLFIKGYQLPNNLFVVGRYDDKIKGGGVDNITSKLFKEYKNSGREGNSMDAVEEFVKHLHYGFQHVIFEGIIVTSVWGRWVKMAQEYPMHFLFLDTPMDVCYQRVLGRNGGKSPKKWSEGKSDLQAKHEGTGHQLASITCRDKEVQRQQSSLEDFHKRQRYKHLPSAEVKGLKYTVLNYEHAFDQLVGILQTEIGLGAANP